MSLSATVVPNSESETIPKKEAMIPAIKLITTQENASGFIRGAIPSLTTMASQNLYFSNTFEAWEKGAHPAPKDQYVVTMKGRLIFEVTDGSTFIIEPGTVLIASDTEGKGHKWGFIDGNEWLRLYIPIDGPDHFIPDMLGK